MTRDHAKSSFKKSGGFILSIVVVLSQIFLGSATYFSEQKAYALACMNGMAMPGCTPPAPTGLFATMSSPTSIFLTWTAPPGESGAHITVGPFTIYRSTLSSGPFATAVGTSTTTSFIDSGLTTNSTYYYEITATDDDGITSPLSNTASATIRMTSGSNTNSTNSGIAVLDGPSGVAYDPSKNEVFVTNSFNDTVSVISDATNDIVSTIPVGDGPSGVAYDPSKNEVFVTNFFDNTVSVISDATNDIVSTIPVGNGPSGVAYDPATNEVFVANNLDDTISVIADTTNNIVSTISVGTEPLGVAYDSLTHRIFVTNSQDSTTSVINDATNIVENTIPVGDGPSGAFYDSVKHEMFVTNSFDDAVSVISDATYSVASTIPVGDGPSNIAYDSTKGEVLITNSNDGTVSIINDTSNVVASTTTVGDEPLGIAYDLTMGEMFVANNYDDTVSIPTDTILSVPMGIMDRSTSNSILLSWNGPPDATDYSIYNSTSLSIPFTLLNTTTTSSYNDTNLNPNTTYYYEVGATNNNAASQPSDPISAMTSPTIPINITATNSSTSVSLSWTGSDGATSYSILRSVNASGIFYPVFSNVKKTAFYDGGLAPNSTYYYEITAKNNGGASSPSPDISAKTMPFLTKPTHVTGTPLSERSIQVSWTASPGATSYTIYESTTPYGPFYIVGTSTMTSFTDSELAPDYTYYYKIKATNMAGAMSLMSNLSPAIIS